MLKIFAIYDEKAESFRFPFFQSTSGLAIRTFSDGANDPRSELSKYPYDFKLFELGTFQEDSALINTHPSPILMGVAIDYKKPDERPDLFPIDSNKI